jgi:HK97 family phage prohead protease
MPVEKCSNGKYKIGDGECIYTSEENANRAYVAYLAEESDKKEAIKNNNVKSKNMIYTYKSLGMEVKDVDTKQGIVSGYFSAFGMVDSDGDIIMPGAFKRSINDWGPDGKGRIKHLLNHDPSQPLGKIKELSEDSYGLKYTSAVGTHNLGRDFVKMVESGLINEHSIGFRTLREQKSG